MMMRDTDVPAVENIYKVSRRIKKREQSLYNALRSIHDDSLFVQEIRNLWHQLPLLANLRCGLWYASQFDGTCYFKSTDGHNGNWSFNTGRLNLHVAQLAAERGGCILVDATRKGKRFPDAMTKTVPIWACVINRALADYRTLHTQETVQLSSVETGNSAGKTEDEEDRAETRQVENWDCSLHLPVWISHVEKGNIERRLQGWVGSLKSTVVDLAPLAKVLRKPLRPLWISQNSVIWLNEIPEVDDWPFTPIILVSASKPSIFTQRYTNAEFSWSYIPGAADDEESWARGLSPALFWKHYSELLEGGPPACNAKVAEIVERERVYRAIRGNHVPQVRVKGGAKCVVVSREERKRSTDGQLQEALGPTMIKPLEASCESLRISDFTIGDRLSVNRKVPTGFHWIGRSGLAVGNEDCGNRNDVFEVVDSVINCGTSSNLNSSCQKESYLYLPIVGSKFGRYSLQNHLAEALLFAKRKLNSDKTVLIYCSDGADISVCVCLAILLSCSKSQGGNFDLSRTESLVTKSDVRQHLIYLSSFNSDARPSRGCLRQVYNFFNSSAEKAAKGELICKRS